MSRAESENIFLLAPLHIKRREEIADMFDVSESTVTEWARDGAPIFIAGNKYQVEYYSLVQWLAKNKPAFKTLSRPPVPPL